MKCGVSYLEAKRVFQAYSPFSPCFYIPSLRISRQDYGNLYDFVTAKNLRIRNKSGKVKL